MRDIQHVTTFNVFRFLRLNFLIPNLAVHPPPPTNALKTGILLSRVKLGPIIGSIPETVQDRGQVSVIHRMSHTGFPFVLKSVTLNDVERRNGR